MDYKSKNIISGVMDSNKVDEKIIHATNKCFEIINGKLTYDYTPNNRKIVNNLAISIYSLMIVFSEYTVEELCSDIKTNVSVRYSLWFKYFDMVSKQISYEIGSSLECNETVEDFNNFMDYLNIEFENVKGVCGLLDNLLNFNNHKIDNELFDTIQEYVDYVDTVQKTFYSNMNKPINLDLGTVITLLEKIMKEGITKHQETFENLSLRMYMMYTLIEEVKLDSEYFDKFTNIVGMMNQFVETALTSDDTVFDSEETMLHILSITDNLIGVLDSFTGLEIDDDGVINVDISTMIYALKKDMSIIRSKIVGGNENA